MGKYSNPPRVFKKSPKPIQNPFIKIELRPIRGGVRRVPKKTRPIAIPTLDLPLLTKVTRTTFEAINAPLVCRYVMLISLQIWDYEIAQVTLN